MTAPRCFSDTSDFLSIRSGDRIRVADRYYLVTGEERERRFGIEEETGIRKIVKLSFFESFDTRLGDLVIRCYRSPEKEERILDLCRNHPNFMQDIIFPDDKNNRVRDVVSGISFMLYWDALNMSHARYFETELPDVLTRVCEAFEAIGFLHAHGFRHGDIRNDHLIVERDSGRFSAGTPTVYASVDEIVEDLTGYLASLYDASNSSTAVDFYAVCRSIFPRRGSP